MNTALTVGGTVAGSLTVKDVTDYGTFAKLIHGTLRSRLKRLLNGLRPLSVAFMWMQAVP